MPSSGTGPYEGILLASPKLVVGFRLLLKTKSFARHPLAACSQSILASLRSSFELHAFNRARLATPRAKNLALHRAVPNFALGGSQLQLLALLSPVLVSGSSHSSSGFGLGGSGLRKLQPPQPPVLPLLWSSTPYAARFNSRLAASLFARSPTSWLAAGARRIDLASLETARLMTRSPASVRRLGFGRAPPSAFSCSSAHVPIPRAGRDPSALAHPTTALGSLGGSRTRLLRKLVHLRWPSLAARSFQLLLRSFGSFAARSFAPPSLTRPPSVPSSPLWLGTIGTYRADCLASRLAGLTALCAARARRDRLASSRPCRRLCLLQQASPPVAASLLQSPAFGTAPLAFGSYSCR